MTENGGGISQAIALSGSCRAKNKCGYRCPKSVSRL
jgi:hypothetical protein